MDTEPLGYITWALPQTLIPLVRARQQYSLLPALDFQKFGIVRKIRKPSDYTIRGEQLPAKEIFFVPTKQSNGNNTDMDDGMSGFPQNYSAFEGPKKEFLLPVGHLWAVYGTVIDRLRNQTEVSNGAEKVFDWLEEKTKRIKLEERVHRSLREVEETIARERLEWAHRKLTNTKYRDTVKTIFRKLKSAFPLKPPESILTGLTRSSANSNRVFTYAKLTIIPNTATINFPSLYNTIHPEKTKIILWELIQTVMNKGSKRHGKSLKHALSYATRKATMHLGKKMKKSKTKRGKLLMPKRLRKEPEKGLATVEWSNTAASDSGQSVGNSSHTSVNGGGANTLGPINTNVASRKGRNSGPYPNKKKTPESLESYQFSATTVTAYESSNRSLNWNERPVPVKTGEEEFYTPEDLNKLRIHARHKYTINMYDLAPDLSAPNPIVDKSPNLPAPELIQTIANLVSNKRWRLSDLFTYADKDKTWKLNFPKIQAMCQKEGLDAVVTEAAILELIFELDEASRDAITFKDLRKGMLAWIKERRVRLRYCMEVQKISLRETTKSAIPLESYLSVTSDGGTRTKTTFLKDQPVVLPKPPPWNPIKRHQAKHNPQPIMPPDDIGTEICKQPGEICRWQGIFPAKLVFAWRIQKKLEDLHEGNHWLEIKKLLRKFGHVRTADESMLTDIQLEQPEEERDNTPVIFTSIENLERLAKLAPIGKQISTDQIFKRLSLKGGRNPFAQKMVAHPNKSVRYSENDADIHLHQHKYIYKPSKIKRSNPDVEISTKSPAPTEVSIWKPEPLNSIGILATHVENLGDKIAETEIGTHAGETAAQNKLGRDISAVKGLNQIEESHPIKPYHFGRRLPSDSKTLIRHLNLARNEKMITVDDVVPNKETTEINSEGNLVKHELKHVQNKSSITGLPHHADQTVYDKFLRKRFREIHNSWLIDPTPNDIFETLQLRAVKELAKVLQNEEDRKKAALDPARKNDSTRELINELAGIFVTTRTDLQPVPFVPPDLSSEHRETNYRFDLRMDLLTKAKGLFAKNAHFVDPRIKAIVAQVRRLKSELSISNADPRKLNKNFSCDTPWSSSSSLPENGVIGERFSQGSTASSASSFNAYDVSVKTYEPPDTATNKRRNGLTEKRFPVDIWSAAPSMESFHNNYSGQERIKAATPSAATSVTKPGTPEITDTQVLFSTILPREKDLTESKNHEGNIMLRYTDSEESDGQKAIQAMTRKTPQTKVQQSKYQVSYTLESYLSETREHIMKGLTKDIKKQAKQMRVSNYQSVEVMERRLVQIERFRKLQESYEGSIQRGMWADFRLMLKFARKRGTLNIVPEEGLRKALLRQEDLAHRVEGHHKALKQFDELLVRAYGGSALNRSNKKWFKRFDSLPSFFALNDDLDLMKTMQAVETFDVA